MAESEGEGEASPAPVNLEVEEREGSNQGLITQALLVGDLESAVDLCIKDGMYPHALTLAAHAGSHLYDKVCVIFLTLVNRCLCGCDCLEVFFIAHRDFIIKGFLI